MDTRQGPAPQIPLYVFLAREVERHIRVTSTKRLDGMPWPADVARESEHYLRRYVRKYTPSGSGLDNGTALDVKASKPERLVFVADFHHMDTNGYYDGWTCHTVIVTPSLACGFVLRITGRDRYDIKDYLYEVYDQALRTMVPEYPASTTQKED